ncbi:MAG: polysaccharide biosynthesis C-terminal domain-containing protein [Ruminococcus sp.]|nr:polysaccharide biosynthesis C-terminal domain-containing protein [Ruminococcus sp.]
MNKYKKLAFNTMIFAIGGFGSKILALLLTRLYTNNIGSSDSSTKELLEITANFLLPIFTFSMAEAVIRFGLDNKYKKEEVFSTAFCLNGVGMILMLIVGPLLKFISFLDFIDGYTILLLSFVLSSSLRSLCSQFVRARGMVKLYSLDGILATLSLFIFNIVFISNFHWGVKGFMLASIMADLCSAIFLFIVAKLDKFLGFRYYSKKLATSMMRFAVPLIPTVIMWVITGFSDRLFIRYMHSDRVALGSSAAGIYGYATKVPNLISMVSTIFFSAWNMSAIMENDSEDRSNFYEKVYGAYESLLFIASAFLIAGVQIVTPLFVSTKNFSEYGDVYKYTPVLVVAVLFMCLDQFLSSIYTATKHTKNSFWTSFAASMANIVLNFFLIPEWGIYGACIATFLSYYLCFWARIIDARYYVPFRFDGIKSFVNTMVLVIMSWVIIAKPTAYILWVLIMIVFVVWSNYKAMIDTAKKLLNRA